MEELPEHKGPPDTWSYSCRCLRCEWEAWWHEGDNDVCPMPEAPDPDGEYEKYWKERDYWSRHRHHPNP